MSDLKFLQYYKTADSKLYLITYFNNKTKYFESHFSTCLISKIKTKKLHKRNVLHWEKKYGLIPQNTTSIISQNPD